MEAMEFQDSQAFNGENLLNFTIWGYVRTNGSIFPGSNGKGGGQSDPIRWPGSDQSSAVLNSTALPSNTGFELLLVHLNAKSWSCSLNVYQITAIELIFRTKHNDNDT
mgnify:CR=1 FL=1